MYITHPIHGAGTRPGRTQPPTATRKTTLNADQCVRQPREGRGRNRQTPPQKKTGGGGRENGPQPLNRPATPQEAAKPPTQKALKTGPPKGAQGDHPAKTSNTKPGAAAHPEKRHPKRADKHHAGTEKKRASNPARKRGDGGTGTTRPGTGTASDRHHKAKIRHALQKKNTPQQPNQEGRGTAKTRAQHPRPHSTPQPGKAGNKRGARTNTHTPRRPSQEWRGAAPTKHPCTAAPTRRCRRPRGTGSRAHTHRNTSPRSGGAQPKPRPQHARPHRTPEPGTAGCRRSVHATTHVPYPQPRKVGWRPKPKPNRKHHKPQPAKEGRQHKPYPNTPAQDPSKDWRRYRNPHPTTTRTQTQAPHNSRKPSVHSPGTEAARAMQLTPPNEIRRPGVWLHPKACAALGLEAERARPKRLGTPVPRTCMHALGRGYARKSGEPLGFRSKEGTCASTGAHPPGETSTSRWR